MTKTIHGKVHGKTIELEEDLGVADGQEVEIQVKVIVPARKWGDGILRTAGALADDPYWDAIMAETPVCAPDCFNDLTRAKPLDESTKVALASLLTPEQLEALVDIANQGGPDVDAIRKLRAASMT